ncbi:hypothetical protein RS9917_13458 [Synechococcus sp. RS9917]|nr:hypothetical protein RS9917_13458 [Synechococcus sp. RS9917]
MRGAGGGPPEVAQIIEMVVRGVPWQYRAIA